MISAAWIVHNKPPSQNMIFSSPKILPRVLLVVLGLFLIGVVALAGSRSRSPGPVGGVLAEAGDVLTASAPVMPWSAARGAASVPAPAFEEALEYEKNGADVEAVAAFEKIVEARPDFLEGYLHLGALYFKLGLPTKAEELYQKAVKKGIADGRIYFNLGFIEESRGDLRKALENYLKAEGKLLRNPELFYNIGNVYARLNDLDQALVYYGRTVSANPGHMDAFVNLSVVSFHKGAYADADFYLDKAVKLGYQAPLEYRKVLEEKINIGSRQQTAGSGQVADSRQQAAGSGVR